MSSNFVEIHFNVLDSITEERIRQDEKWGSQRELPSGTWYLILGEEFGEVGNAVLEGSPTLRDELVQVAAVATAWIEALDEGR